MDHIKEQTYLSPKVFANFVLRTFLFVGVGVLGGGPFFLVVNDGVFLSFFP